MARNYKDWLTAFLDYSSIGEAPRHVYFWTGVSTIAGALRRKTWIDMGHFKWYPNFYIVLVAPPGIISKSTTAAIGMKLLRQVQGVKFGPSVITWQALVGALGEAAELYELDGVWHPMAALTIESSEFGNLLNPLDREMVDIYVSMWDSIDGTFEKKTKASGNDAVTNPWLNMIACTTPAWIAGNFPEYMIGGGFTSRCIFVYAEEKANFRAYPRRTMARSDEQQTEMAARLVEDLHDMATNLAGEYKLTEDAYRWGEAWYEEHYTTKHEGLTDDRFAGYLARKQTHIHKLAMILAASEGNALWITPEHLSTALAMVTDLEPDMSKVFDKIGKTDEALQIERMVNLIQNSGPLTYAEAYASVHAYFPNHREFSEMLEGCVKAGFLIVQPSGGVPIIRLGPSALRASSPAGGIAVPDELGNVVPLVQPLRVG